MKGRNENCMKMDKLLRKNDYRMVRTKGSHFIYTNGLRTVSVNKDLNKCVFSRLVKENELTDA